MKIYFAGSIRGGRYFANRYYELISYIRKRAEVLTEHISDSKLEVTGEEGMSDQEIYERDMDWLMSCDAVIAEVTAPSLGVGYEIGCAEMENKPVLCLFDKDSDMTLSAMLSGNKKLIVKNYSGIDQAKKAIDEFYCFVSNAE